MPLNIKFPGAINSIKGFNDDNEKPTIDLGELEVEFQTRLTEQERQEVYQHFLNKDKKSLEVIFVNEQRAWEYLTFIVPLEALQAVIKQKTGLIPNTIRAIQAQGLKESEKNPNTKVGRIVEYIWIDDTQTTFKYETAVVAKCEDSPSNVYLAMTGLTKHTASDLEQLMDKPLKLIGPFEPHWLECEQTDSKLPVVAVFDREDSTWIIETIFAKVAHRLIELAKAQNDQTFH